MEDRLESWKEIAAYLQRDIRTVQRWERLNGLPVYRRPGRRLGGVFAHRSELDAWRRDRPQMLQAPANGVGRPALQIAGAVCALALTFLQAGPLSGSCAPVAGLVSWFRADGDVRDAVRDHHGIAESGIGFGPGRIQQALVLDGRSSRVRVPAPGIGSIAKRQLTVAAWVRFRSVINLNTPHRSVYDDMSLVDRMASSPERLTFLGVNLDGWRLLKQNDHRFWFCLGGREINKCGRPTHTVFSTTLAQNDQWYHVAAVKGDRDFSIYVNGVMEDSRALPAADTMLDTGVADVLLGSNATEGAFLNGALDEVMLFERAVSPRELFGRLARAAVSDECGNE